MFVVIFIRLHYLFLISDLIDFEIPIIGYWQLLFFIQNEMWKKDPRERPTAKSVIHKFQDITTKQVGLSVCNIKGVTSLSAHIVLHTFPAVKIRHHII